MARYVKKPVEIDAHQFFLPTADRHPRDGAPDWFIEALRADVITRADDGAWYVQTLESGGLAPRHLISDGDFVILGIAGELYACKPDIFAATYEAVAA